MANITIVDLPLVTGMVDGTELFETVQPGSAQNGVSKSIVITDIMKVIGVLDNLTLPVSSDVVAVFRPSTSEIYNAEISALGLPLGNLPAGGTTGQYLAKNSNADYDTGWYTLPTFGTVTSFSAGNLSPLFTTSVANATTTPALTFALSNAAANTYFGNATGGATTPSFTAAAALSKVDDTNVTLTLGGAPTTALLTATSLTLGWTGQLALSRGGTAANLTASNGGLVYSTASALAVLAGTATANQIPLSGSSSAPSWSTAVYPSTAAAGTVMAAATANTFAATATPTLGITGSVLGTLTLAGNTSGAVVVRPAAAAGSWTLTLPDSAGTSGYVLSTNGSGITSWVAAGSGSPGGSDTQLQYNNAGSFGGISGAITNGTVVTLTSALATTAFSPSSNDGAALGSGGASFSDLFLASGALINFANGNAIITHSSAILTLDPGDFRVTTAGTNTASVVTVGGTQTLTNKTLTSPAINTATIVGGTINNAVIGGSTPVAGTFTNVVANNVAPAYTTTATAAGTTTLTVSSTQFQYFTGSTTQTVVLPVTSTLTTGHRFTIVNNSTGVVTVQSSGANNVLVMGGNSTADFVCILTSGTSAASWSVLASYATIPQNSQSADYTTVLSDSGKHILHPTADNNARTFTIDSNANVPYPIGTTITFINQINTVTIAITSDTLTLSPGGSTGSRTLAASGMATAIKVTSTLWFISGTGLT